jgi:hypothetical protein
MLQSRTLMSSTTDSGSRSHAWLLLLNGFTTTARCTTAHARTTAHSRMQRVFRN